MFNRWVSFGFAAGIFSTCTASLAQTFVPSRIADISPGIASSDLTSLTPLSDAVYFWADDGITGYELWRTYGSSANTQRVIDLNPGLPTGRGSVSFNVAGNRLYFTGRDDEHGDELWSSDGTESGTVLVADINPGSAPSFPANVVTSNGLLFFAATGSSSSGAELWASNGSAGGTALVKDIRSGNLSSSPRNLIPINGRVVFSASISSTATELWTSDGTPSGTSPLNGVQLGSSAGEFFHAPDGSIYFRALDSTHGRELWRTNGTSEGTYLVKDIRPGTAASSPRSYSALGQTVYFVTSNGSVDELWETDGTPDGTAAVDVGSANLPATLDLFAAVGDTLCFTAVDDDNNYSLWKTNGTPEETALIAAFDDNARVEELHVVGKRLFFTTIAEQSGMRSSLWVLDDVDFTPRQIIETPGIHVLTPAMEKAEIRELTSLGDRLLFRAPSSADENGVNIDFELFSILIPNAGDADEDGDVDLSDLSLLAGSYGLPINATWTNGDFDADGDVDLSDLSALAGNYGDGEAQAFADFQTALNIPEPATATVLWVAITFVRPKRKMTLTEAS